MFFVPKNACQEAFRPLKPPVDAPCRIPMGRPLKQPDERRTERLSGVSLTAAERAYVGELVSRSGLPEAEFCRRTILRQRVAARPVTAGSEAVAYELNRIGNNLNQIAHAANMGKLLAGKLDAALDELRAVMARMEAADGS